MMFSTEAVKQIEKIIVSDFANQIAAEKLKACDLEDGLRRNIRAVARNSFVKMLTLLDEHNHGIEVICECGEKGKRVSKRETQVLGVFGWSSYRRSYYKCELCGQNRVALDKAENLRAGATPLMSSLLALSGITVSFEEAREQIRQYLAVDVSARNTAYW